MKGFFKGALIFAVGFYLGSVATKKYLDKVYFENDEEEYIDDTPEQDVEEFDDSEFKKGFDSFIMEHYRELNHDTGLSDQWLWDMYTQHCDNFDVPAVYTRRRFLKEFKSFSDETWSISTKNKYNDLVSNYDTSEDIIPDEDDMNESDDLEVDDFVDFEDTNDDVEERDSALPYFIDECDYEAIDGWDSDDYTIFSDGYITDSFGIPIEDDQAEELFGVNFHVRFEREGHDQIWIRNPRLKMDFSIARDLDKFADVGTLSAKRMVGLA